ncbi:lycopene cyclase domain-containing protein [Pilimelia columellifera]|uniref:Lycopene cyclase domain-containing protein n=1 Tax=Pilimelia columellifera subsp. columellifera TaxID=706583 RepID=A0ABN3NA09_9ACTN
MGRYTYLAVLAGCLLAAVWLEPLFRVRVLRRWRRLTLTVLPVAAVFILWDLAAIAAGHWTFDPDQTLGVSFGPLPLEEALFFLVVPICALLGFEGVRASLRRRAATTPETTGDPTPDGAAGARANRQAGPSGEPACSTAGGPE